MTSSSRLRAWSYEIRDAFGSVELFPVIAVLLAAAAATASFILSPANTTRLAQFTPEHIASLNIYDTSGQRRAYFIFFALALAGGIALGIFARTHRGKFSDRPLLASLLGTLLIATILSPLSRPREGLLAVPLLIAAAFLTARPQYRKWVWGALALFVLLAVVPGLVGTPIIDPSIYFSIDTHYTPFFAHGERIAAGKILFVDILPDYSPLIVVITGIFAKASAVPDLGLLVRVVQMMQLLCLATFLAASWQRTRESESGGRSLALLVTALAATPWLGTLAYPLWQPTGSGVRFLMLPVAALVSCRLKIISPLGAGLLVGAIAALAVLYNPETGVAASAGLTMAWLVRVRSEKLSVALSSMIAGATAFAAGIVTFFVFYRTAFGAWPLPQNLQALTNLASLFGAGYGGTRLQYRPIAVIIALHAGYILIRAIRSLLDRNADASDPASAAIATTLLVMFPYYVNRAVDWNLWSFIALYSLLLAPLIADAKTRLVTLCVAAFLMLPQALNLARPNLIAPLASPRLAWGWKSGCADGLLLPESYCAAVKARTDTVRQVAGVRVPAPLLVTRMPYLMMRTTGLTGPFGSIDIFGMTPTNAAYNALVREIKGLHSQTILFDNPDDPHFPLRAESINNFNKRLRASIGGYCLTKTEGGWQIFERDGNCPPERR